MITTPKEEMVKKFFESHNDIIFCEFFRIKMRLASCIKYQKSHAHRLQDHRGNNKLTHVAPRFVVCKKCKFYKGGSNATKHKFLYGIA